MINLGRSRPAHSDSRTPPPVRKTSSLPVQRSRVWAERSPTGTAESKASNKANTTPGVREESATDARIKVSELRAKSDVIEQELKTTKEKLVHVEQDNVQLIQELKESKQMADEANQKLDEAIATKKKQFERKMDVDKFGASEPGKGTMGSDRRNETNHNSELESLRRQHALDVSALLSVIEELQKGKHELLDTIDAKNAALSRADDAKRIAETNAEKVEHLSGEVSRLKALLGSKLDSSNKEAAEVIKKLSTEVDSLKLELGRAELAEEKLIETTLLSGRLQDELNDVKVSESNASKLADVWRMKATSLEVRLEDAQQAKRCTSINLACNVKKLEESGTLLQDAETEIQTLKGKMRSLEIEVAKYKFSLKESDQRIDLLQQEALNLGQTIAMLKSELQKLEKEKLQALSNEMIATSNARYLCEEKNKLIDELNSTREEGEMIKNSMALDLQVLLEEKNKWLLELNASREEGDKFKKAMDGFASALHQMSTESIENQEKLAIKQAVIEDAHLQIEQINSVLDNSKESYQIMIDEARYEIACLKKSVERFETEAGNSNTELEAQKVGLVNEIEKSEDELASLKVEMEKVVESLKVTEEEAEAAKACEVEMLSKLRQVEYEASITHEMKKEAEIEIMHLRNQLLDKENELQNITRQNNDLQMREASSQQKILELSALLADATAKKRIINDESLVCWGEKELLANSSGLPRNNVPDVQAERLKPEVTLEMFDSHLQECQQTKEENKEKSHKDKYKYPVVLMSKDLATERHRKVASMDDSIFHQMKDLSRITDDGTTSPMNQHPQQKKKKAFLHKLGNLLLRRACSKY